MVRNTDRLPAVISIVTRSGSTPFTAARSTTDAMTRSTRIRTSLLQTPAGPAAQRQGQAAPQRLGLFHRRPSPQGQALLLLEPGVEPRNQGPSGQRLRSHRGRTRWRFLSLGCNTAGLPGLQQSSRSRVSWAVTMSRGRSVDGDHDADASVCPALRTAHSTRTDRTGPRRFRQAYTGVRKTSVRITISITPITSWAVTRRTPG